MKIISNCLVIFLMLVGSAYACAEERYETGHEHDQEHHRYYREPIRCYWYDMQPYEPHNVAGRVLEFTRDLDLSHKQVSHMARLVEDYDRENRDRERELETARKNLFAMLRQEDIEFAQAVQFADRITATEFYLWQEYIDHLQRVKRILTPVQNRILGTLWEIRCKPR